MNKWKNIILSVKEMCPWEHSVFGSVYENSLFVWVCMAENFVWKVAGEPVVCIEVFCVKKLCVKPSVCETNMCVCVTKLSGAWRTFVFNTAARVCV